MIRFALLALSAFSITACDGRAPSAPEAEPDGGLPAPEPEPMLGEPEPTTDPEPEPCGLEADPLGRCAAPSAVDEACTVRIEGDRDIRITLDAAGRQTSVIDGRSGFARGFDADGRQLWRQDITDGCVARAVESRFEGDRVLTAFREPAQVRCEAATVVDGEWLRLTVDQGCDCTPRLALACDPPGPYGPPRCTRYAPDGAVAAVETWTYDAEGHLLEQALDTGGDGVVERRETARFDDRGRPVELLIECRDCEVAGGVERHTWRYEDMPVRVTHRVDVADDGRIEFVEVTTRVAGRVVRVERGDGEGVTTVIETRYGEDGGRETVTTERGEVVRTERVAVEGPITTTTVETPAGRTVEAVEVDAAGRLVRRTIARDPGEDFAETLTWDGDGRLVAEQVTEGDWGCAVRYGWSGECPAPAGRFNQPCAPPR